MGEVVLAFLRRKRLQSGGDYGLQLVHSPLLRPGPKQRKSVWQRHAQSD